MEFIIKTNPTPQNVLGRKPYNIIGIIGNIYDIPLTLEDTDLKVSFFFQFIDEEKKNVGNINAYSEDIKNRIIQNRISEGDTEEVAKDTAISIIDTVVKDLLAGSKEERYSAMQQFASIYSLTLLPIEEQDGVFSTSEDYGEEK